MKRNSKYADGVFIGVEEVDKAILEFIDYREELKKPMTDRAITIFLKKLREIASTKEEMIECIEVAILNNWLSVYPLKERRYNGQSRGCNQQDTDQYSDEFTKLFG